MHPHPTLTGYAPTYRRRPSVNKADALQNTDPAAQRQGTTILVYTTYPNGNPIDVMSHKQVNEILKVGMPGTQIDELHLMYGRVQNEKEVDVGAIVYPITESQYRSVQSVIERYKGDSFRIEEAINKKYLPEFIKEDTKKGEKPPLIYDLSRKRLIFPEEIKKLALDKESTSIKARDRQKTDDSEKKKAEPKKEDKGSQKTATDKAGEKKETSLVNVPTDPEKDKKPTATAEGGKKAPTKEAAASSLVIPLNTQPQDEPTNDSEKKAEVVKPSEKKAPLGGDAPPLKALSPPNGKEASFNKKPSPPKPEKKKEASSAKSTTPAPASQPPAPVMYQAYTPMTSMPVPLPPIPRPLPIPTPSPSNPPPYYAPLAPGQHAPAFPGISVE